MSSICGMMMMMRRKCQHSGSVTLPSGPSHPSQKPPTALSTSRNSSEPRSRTKDADEGGALTGAHSGLKDISADRTFECWKCVGLTLKMSQSTSSWTFPLCYCSFAQTWNEIKCWIFCLWFSVPSSWILVWKQRVRCAEALLTAFTGEAKPKYLQFL